MRPENVPLFFPKEGTMKYLFQNYPGSSVEELERLSAGEQQAIRDEYLAIRELPGVVAGAQLQPVETATTVRVQNGEMLLTDGPFIDAKEHVGGLLMVEVRPLVEI
ncbi:MAG TPA: YciI family protein [Solirubrobacteraceae bacterium]